MEVVLDLVDNHLLAHIDQLDVCEIALILVDRLVDLLVVSDAVSEVRCSYFWVLSYVVWRRGLDFQNVAHNQILVVAFRFDK